jgi:hypothetical protein
MPLGDELGVAGDPVLRPMRAHPELALTPACLSELLVIEERCDVAPPVPSLGASPTPDDHRKNAA